MFGEKKIQIRDYLRFTTTINLYTAEWIDSL